MLQGGKTFLEAVVDQYHTSDGDAAQHIKG
jgi:hypothetical protein